MRRYKEAVRQRWLRSAVSTRAEAEAGFRPTTNARNEKMLEEAARFARYVRTVDQHLSRVSRDAVGFGSQVKTLLMSELPRHYTKGGNGETLPASPQTERVGTGVDVERVARAGQVLELRMKEEVQGPLSEWLSAFERAKTLMKKLEATRLELDSRRRTVLSLSARMKFQQFKLENTQSMIKQQEAMQPKHEALESRQKANVERTESILSRKTQKRDALEAEFHETEEECTQVMHALLKDATNMRDFVAQSFRILHETFFEAYQGFAGTDPENSPSQYPPAASPDPYPAAQSPAPHSEAQGPDPYSVAHNSHSYPPHLSGGAWNTNQMS